MKLKFGSRKGQGIPPVVLVIAAGAGMIYLAGEGIMHAEHWAARKAKAGMAHIFHNKPAAPKTTKP